MRSFFLYSSPVVPNPHFLLLAMWGMLSILLALTGFILVYLMRSRQRKKQRARWRQDLNVLLQRAIYFETPADNPEPIPIPFRIVRGLRHPAFRQLLIDELVQGKKALSGMAGANLVVLFNQLGLQEDARQKLKSRKWHIQARGIQELAMMGQQQFQINIYRLTNTHHELVRMEAQSAIVQLYGFEGLRFLDVTDRPLSDWQQMKLLQLLAHAGSTGKMGSWLLSPNPSVRIFALKLAGEHHYQECHDQVLGCLGDADPAVRLQAIRCLREIPTDGTSRALARVYPQQSHEVRLAILETLGHIGSEEDFAFLASQLSQDDGRLVLEAARALAVLGGKGALDEFPLADKYPWNIIIPQTKNERVP